MKFSMIRWLLTLAVAAGFSPAVFAQTAPLPPSAEAPLTPKAVTPFAPAVAPTVAETMQAAPIAPLYANPDTADLEARIAKLELDLKKKQDKADSKKAFTRVIDGRIYFDSYNVMNQDGADAGSPDTHGNLKNWNGVRDARIGVKGEGFGIFEYKVDLCFIEGTGSTGNNAGVNFKDVWLSVKNVPLLEYVRIGHYRVEDGVSNMVGGTNTTFMDFSGRDFAMSRRIGMSTRHLWLQDRLRFFAGMFFENDIVTNKRFSSNQDNQGTITNLRLTYMPYISRGKDGKIDGKRFMMFGGHYSYVDVTKRNEATSVRFRSRFDGLNIGNIYDITMDTSNYQKFGFEFAAQNGPLALQAEAFINVYDNASTFAGGPRRDRTIGGGYLEARYFLTGDYRKFSAANATWGAVDLKHNLDLRKVNDVNYACWLGGWELAAKWGYTDLTDFWNEAPAGLPACGDVHDLTVGLNWYWSSQARWMLQYSHVMPNRIRDGVERDSSATDLLALSFRYNF